MHRGRPPIIAGAAADGSSSCGVIMREKGEKERERIAAVRHSGALGETAREMTGTQPDQRAKNPNQRHTTEI